MIDNFVELPMIVEGFKYYKNRSSLSANFIYEIENLIEAVQDHE